jgi:DHA3 family macrolide efflux protein-like MFS transporter
MTKNWQRNIILFLASQTISLFGSSLVQYAIMWYITLETKSGIMMTISIICGFLPTLFLSPFAGVWVDRFSRKSLIILADALIALSTLISAIIFIKGFGSLWLLFVMSAIRALGAAVQMPAVGALIPQIVPEDKLTQVNGANGSIMAIVNLISPMVSAALLIMTTLELIFFIDVVTAIIAILILLLFLPIPVHAKALNKEPISYFNDLAQGFNYIKKHEFIKKFFYFMAIFLILVTPVAFLTPLQVARSFGDDVWRLTAIEIAFSLGMMAGGAIIATWGGFKNKIHTMTLSIFLTGMLTFLLGVTPIFSLYLVFMVISGVAMPIFHTPATVLLQEKVEADFLGRIFGILTMISSAVMPLGMLVFGPLSDLIEIEWLLMGTGLLIFIQGFFLIKNNALLEAGKPIVKQE